MFLFSCRKGYPDRSSTKHKADPVSSRVLIIVLIYRLRMPSSPRLRHEEASPPCYAGNYQLVRMMSAAGDASWSPRILYKGERKVFGISLYRTSRDLKKSTKRNRLLNRGLHDEASGIAEKDRRDLMLEGIFRKPVA